MMLYIPHVISISYASPSEGLKKHFLKNQIK